MIVVLDASAVIDLMLRTDPGERAQAYLSEHPEVDLVTIAHLDAEVLSGLARLYRGGHLSGDEVDVLLVRLASLPATRLPVTGELLGRAWDMHANVAARDALYVAAAELLGGCVLSTDTRLARAVPDLVVRLEDM